MQKIKNNLEKIFFSENEINIVSDAIRDHSFSQNKKPETLEGKILKMLID